MRASRGVLLIALATLALVVADGVSTGAHKPITSKYTYTADVFPLFRDRCGACHQPEGVAPMSLLTYQDARPWAQSIKDEVINLRMPPRYAEVGFGSVRNGHGLTAREMDTIVEWANGGTPQGPREISAASAGTGPEAPRAAAPDLTLTLPEFTLAKDVTEDTRFFAIPTGLTADRFVRALEVAPGAPAIVRSVVVSVDLDGKARALDEAFDGPGFTTAGGVDAPTRDVLAVWQPGQDALIPANNDGTVAYRLPARADLVVRVRFKKTFRQEGQDVSDRTTVGLWFTQKPPRHAIERLAIASPAGSSGRSDTEVSLTETMKHDVHILAVLPNMATKLDSMRVEAIRPDGSREPMLLLTHPSPEWPTRYWFQAPVALPKGSRIEVVAMPGPAERSGPVGVQLEYVVTNLLDRSR